MTEETTPKAPSGKCNEETEVYSRVTGYHRPVKLWNKGKQEEFRNRKSFNQTKIERQMMKFAKQRKKFQVTLDENGSASGYEEK